MRLTPAKKPRSEVIIWSVCQSVTINDVYWSHFPRQLWQTLLGWNCRALPLKGKQPFCNEIRNLIMEHSHEPNLNRQGATGLEYSRTRSKPLMSDCNITGHHFAQQATSGTVVGFEICQIRLYYYIPLRILSKHSEPSQSAFFLSNPNILLTCEIICAMHSRSFEGFSQRCRCLRLDTWGGIPMFENFQKTTKSTRP